MTTTFSERIALAVREAGVTRPQLAAAIGQTTANMSHWFTGRAKHPSAEAVSAAAQFLGVATMWLARGEGPMRLEQKQMAATRNGEPPPTPQELVDEMYKEAAEMVAAWLALPEVRRHEYKRQIEAESLQHRKPAEGRSVTTFGQAGKARQRDPA